MNGHGHRATALATYVLAAPFMPLHGPAEITVGAVVAVATSSGKLLSPDCDLGWAWSLADKLIPDEAILDDNGPMQHRGITHYWLWPVLVWLVSLAPWTLVVAVQGHEFRLAGWLFASVAVGHGSHVIADFVVGAAGQGRSAGVPLMPWWAHVGLGFRCGGVVETFLTTAIVPAAAALALWLHLRGYPEMPALAEVASWRP